MNKRVSFWFPIVLLTAVLLTGCDLFGDEGDPSTLHGDGGLFGNRVALHSDHLLVTAQFDEAGAVFVFERGAGGWEQRAKLRAPDLGRETYDFAWSVATGDERAAVGALGEAQGPGGGNAKPGRVLLYERRGGGWEEQTQFASNEAEKSDGFGHAIAIREDQILVGALRKDFEGSTVGAAYLYECEQNGCSETAKFQPDDLRPLDFFGSAVALGEGRVVVGAHGNDKPSEGGITGDNRGGVYVFERSGAGWQQSAKLLPREAETAGSGFQGLGVDLALDSRHFVVAASNDDVDGLPAAGAAYVFEQGAGGTWQQAARLTAPDPGQGDYFGRRVDVSGDYIIAGADLADRGRGAAYIFHRESDGTWKLQAKLQPEEAGRSHFFGSDVAIDGHFAVVGMPGEDGEKGAAYVYERRSGDWVRYGTG